MTRLIDGLILAACIAALIYAATVRPDRHPLLIDAAYDPWCGFIPGPPLVGPRGKYDYRVGQRRNGDIA